MVALAIAHWDGDHTAAQQAYRQALNLDSSYRDRTFWSLKQALAPAQIQTAEQVLSASNPNNFQVSELDFIH